MLLHWTFIRKFLCEAISQAFAWNCRAEAALRSYFLNFCMKLSCKSCLAKLFLKLLHATVVRKFLCGAIYQAFVWNCCANVAFRSYPSSLSPSMELSCKDCLVKLSLKVKYRWVFPSSCDVLLNKGRGLGRSLRCVGRNPISLSMILHGTVVHKLLAKLSLKLLHGTVVQTLPFEAIPRAFHLVWNCHAKIALQSYLSRWSIGEYFHHIAMCFWIRAEVLGAVWDVLGAIQSVCPRYCVELSCISCLQSYLLSFCMELSCKRCLT